MNDNELRRGLAEASFSAEAHPLDAFSDWVVAHKLDKSTVSIARKELTEYENSRPAKDRRPAYNSGVILWVAHTAPLSEWYAQYIVEKEGD